MPEFLKMIKRTEKININVKIPKENPMMLIFPERVSLLVLIRLKIFMPITGKTHGIKFKIKPPKKANIRLTKKPVSGSGK